MDAQTLITKLQAQGAESLAALSVESILSTPLEVLVPATTLASTTRKGLDAWLAAPSAVTALSAVVEALVQRAQSERRPLKEVLAEDVRAALRNALSRPFSPDRRLVLTIIDREPTRELVRQLLLDAVLEFGRKASAPVAGVARGLGSLARLAGETVKSRSGSLGTLVGAVSDEVERQLEKRATEFVDSALAGVFGKIADAVSDPSRADEASELRKALLDGILELTGPQLARELVNLDVVGGAEVVRSGLRHWLASPQSEEQLLAFAKFILERSGTQSVREVLIQLGLLEIARSLAQEQLTLRIRAISQTPEFSAWLEGLFSEG